MFTPTTDYNQQLLAYLQTWRELLERWTTMAAGLPSPTAPSATPFMPPMPPTPPMVPFAPPMPPSAPVPPAPADYTQQLFSYLQAWRQYLEQMTGARPGSPQASTAQPPTAQPAYASENHPANEGGRPRPVRPPDVPIPPDYDGSKTPAREVRKGSDPSWPPLRDLPPRREDLSAHPPDLPSVQAGLFNRGREEPQMLRRPDYDFVRIDRARRRPDTSGPGTSSARPEASHYAEAPAERAVGSPFLRALGRVAPNPSPVLAPKSLFSSPAARTASARLREAGQTPSP